MGMDGHATLHQDEDDQKVSRPGSPRASPNRDINLAIMAVNLRQRYHSNVRRSSLVYPGGIMVLVLINSLM